MLSLYFQFHTGNVFMLINSKYNVAIVWNRNKGFDIWSKSWLSRSGVVSGAFDNAVKD